MSPRSASPSKSIRSLAKHLKEPGEAGRRGSVMSSSRGLGGGAGIGREGNKDGDKAGKKGLWNLFSAEYEI